MRTDYQEQFIGEGEDAAFEILKKLTGLRENPHAYYPEVGLYRQLPVTMIYDSDQLQDLAPYHKKSSVDIMIVWCNDKYNPKMCKIAVRVEGKKGSLKMVRQGVQAGMLAKHCQVVDMHKRECEELFKDEVNVQSVQEVISSFHTARVSIPVITDKA